MFKSKKLIFYAVLLFTALLAADLYLVFTRPKELKVIFFDVVQGDSALIKTAEGQNILIDGGPNSRVTQKLGRNLPFYNRDIDLMILTHPHADHLTGLLDVLKRYKVKKVLMNRTEQTTAEYLEFLSLIKQKNIPAVEAAAGLKIVLNQDLFLSVFYAGDDDWQKVYAGKNEPLDLNDTSIVFKLVSSELKVLFTGDISHNVEKYLLAQNYDLSADILKVAHHGSNLSSSVEFLKAVAPRLAVISVGAKNKFGHPGGRVIKNLKDLGVEMKRTDIDGDVVISSKFKVQSAKLQFKIQN